MSSERMNPKLAAYRAMKHVKGLSRNRLARVHPQPIFIFGNQKSGTSAVAALRGGRVRGANSVRGLRRRARRGDRGSFFAPWSAHLGR